MSGSIGVSVPLDASRWQIWAITAGSVVVYGAVRSGVASSFAKFVSQNKALATFVTTDMMSWMVGPARHLVNAGTALIQVRNALAEANRDLTAVLPMLPDVPGPGGLNDQDVDALILNGKDVISKIGLKAAFSVGQPLFRYRSDLLYVWDAWRSMFSSSTGAVRTALDIYRMAASFTSSDVKHGVGLAILMVGVSEMSYQMYFAHADKMATQDNIAALYS
jgi:hypothetical protein